MPRAALNLVAAVGVLFVHAAAWAKGPRRAIEVQGFPDVVTKALWYGFVEGDDNFALVNGDGNDNATLIYDGQRLTLTEAGCPGALKTQLKKACAKLPAAPKGPIPVLSLANTGSGSTPLTVSPVPVVASPPSVAGEPPKPTDDQKVPAKRVADPLQVPYDEAVTLAGGSSEKGKAWAARWTGQNPDNLYDASNDRAVLLFDEAGKSYGTLPQVDEDDTIVVAVVSLDPTKPVKNLRVQKCTRGKEVRVGGGAGIVKARAAREQEPISYVLRRADHCGSEEGFEATFQDSADKTITISISTLALNRFTVGLGLLFDASRPGSFRPQTVKGDAVPVIIDDSHVEGLSSAVFVSLRISKVDLVRERRCAQMFSPALGVSITAPTQHLYLALNFEPFPGFGVLFGYHAYRDDHLGGGLAVGDRFPAGDPPVDRRWRWWGDQILTKHPPLFLGVNLDSSLLSAFLAAFNR